MLSQTQHEFMWSFVAKYNSQLAHHTRCLDWDGWYGGSVFAAVCSEVDVIEYGKPFGRVAPKRLRWQARRQRAARWYLADAHSMASYLDRGSYDLIIANSVFEHLHQPFVAMGEVHTPTGHESQTKGSRVSRLFVWALLSMGAKVLSSPRIYCFVWALPALLSPASLAAETYLT